MILAQEGGALQIAAKGQRLKPVLLVRLTAGLEARPYKAISPRG